MKTANLRNVVGVPRLLCDASSFCHVIMSWIRSFICDGNDCILQIFLRHEFYSFVITVILVSARLCFFEFLQQDSLVVFWLIYYVYLFCILKCCIRTRLLVSRENKQFKISCLITALQKNFPQYSVLELIILFVANIFGFSELCYYKI